MNRITSVSMKTANIFQILPVIAVRYPKMNLNIINRPETAAMPPAISSEKPELKNPLKKNFRGKKAIRPFMLTVSEMFWRLLKESNRLREIISI